MNRSLTVEHSEIASFINDLFLTRSSILGAELGSKLKQRFPAFDIKLHFSGIRGLLQGIGLNNIKAVNRRGLDWVFERCENQDAVLDTTTKESVWRAFHNPNFAGEIVLNKTTLSLKVVPSDEAINIDELKIPRLSHEDQRKMMNKFVTETQSNIDIATIIARPDQDYWSVFAQTIRSQHLQKEWLNFRWNYLKSELINRLTEQGVSDEKAIKLTERSIEDDNKCRAKTSSQILPKRQLNEGPPLELRALAHLIIDHLPDQELASIRVTLSSVLESLRSQS